MEIKAFKIEGWKWNMYYIHFKDENNILSNSIFTLDKTRSFCDYNNNIHRHKFVYTEIYTLSYNLIITRLLDTVATLEISFKVVIKKFKLPQYFS